MTAEQVIMIVSVLFGGSGFIIGILNWRQGARKDSLNELKQIIDEVQEENQRLRSRLEELERENIALQKELRTWKNHAENQNRVIVSGGLCPPAFPES